MNIMLGNLSVHQIEERLGVRFSEELKQFMFENQQQEASNVKPGKWHCFDIPFNLVCGDFQTAQKIFNDLKHNTSFKTKLQISIQK